LDQWLTRLPTFHDDDRPLFEAACARLIAGAQRESLTVRLKFAEADWLSTEIEFIVVTREPAAQALIQVGMASDG
jgi:hypothetical protein